MRHHLMGLLRWFFSTMCAMFAFNMDMSAPGPQTFGGGRTRAVVKLRKSKRGRKPARLRRK